RAGGGADRAGPRADARDGVRSVAPGGGGGHGGGGRHDFSGDERPEGRGASGAGTRRGHARGERLKHFITTQEWSRADRDALLDHAAELKREPFQPLLEGRAVALVFFNPSLRTRSSFEIGAWQMGGHAVVLEPGQGAWAMAFGDGEVMDGDAEEHVREAARVLSRYCDLIAV